MVCQICENVMPFKRFDGNYYFEAVECVSNVGYEFDENYLALCPVCAAKYQHVRQTKDEAIKDAIVNGNDLKISVVLAGKDETIRFVEQHIHDLRIVLKNE